MITRTILVVEDDKDLQQYLRELLGNHLFSIHSASTGAVALKALKKISPDLVILDLNLPDISGEMLCKEIKKDFPNIIVIILTAKDTTADVVNGLKSGADDYIKKPFEGEELIARVTARLRNRDTLTSTLKVDNLIVDTEKMEVKRGNKSISLTPQEFKLLEYLIMNKGKVLSRDMILNRLWLSSPDVETRIVDVYIGYLRKKIDTEFTKKLLHSVRGFGYILRD